MLHLHLFDDFITAGSESMHPARIPGYSIADVLKNVKKNTKLSIEDVLDQPEPETTLPG